MHLWFDQDFVDRAKARHADDNYSAEQIAEARSASEANRHQEMRLSRVSVSVETDHALERTGQTQRCSTPITGGQSSAAPP